MLVNGDIYETKNNSIINETSENKPQAPGRGKPKIITKKQIPPLHPPTKPETLLLKLTRSGIYPSISAIKSLWVGRSERDKEN